PPDRQTGDCARKNYCHGELDGVHRRTLDGIGLEFRVPIPLQLGFYGNSCQKQCQEAATDMLGTTGCLSHWRSSVLPATRGPGCTYAYLPTGLRARHLHTGPNPV
uniref:Apple domain-containing protein n=1 Tax=Macrostomum lignano TaxID=282301 RepID=A0A1I8FQX3_9PLAT